MISEINIQETSPLFKPNWINHNVMLCFRGEFSNGKIKKKIDGMERAVLEQDSVDNQIRLQTTNR